MGTKSNNVYFTCDKKQQTIPERGLLMFWVLFTIHSLPSISDLSLLFAYDIGRNEHNFLLLLFFFDCVFLI